MKFFYDKNNNNSQDDEEDKEDEINGKESIAPRLSVVHSDDRYAKGFMPSITVFICDRNSSIIGQSLIDAFEMIKGFTIVADNSSTPLNIISNHYFSTSSNISLVILNSQLHDHILKAWLSVANCEENWAATAIILSSVSRCELLVNSNNERTLLRKLQTSTSRICNTFDCVTSIPDLEIGNVISGAPAAILNFYEARSLRAISFLTIAEPYLSIASMKAFEDTLPMIESLTGRKVNKPSREHYTAATRNDAFISRTETLYC